MDVNEISIWEECPFKRQLPSWVVVRRGDLFGEESLILHAKVKDSEFHIDYDLKSGENWNDVIPPMLSNLAGAIFESEFPGQTGVLFRRQAKCARQGEELSSADSAMFSRLQELSKEAKAFSWSAAA